MMNLEKKILFSFVYYRYKFAFLSNISKCSCKMSVKHFDFASQERCQFRYIWYKTIHICLFDMLTNCVPRIVCIFMWTLLLILILLISRFLIEVNIKDSRSIVSCSQLLTFFYFVKCYKSKFLP